MSWVLVLPAVLTCGPPVLGDFLKKLFKLFFKIEFESYGVCIEDTSSKVCFHCSEHKRLGNSLVLFRSLGLTRKAQVWLFSCRSQISVCGDFPYALSPRSPA